MLGTARTAADRLDFGATLTGADGQLADRKGICAHGAGHSVAAHQAAGDNARTGVRRISLYVQSDGRATG